ncbi:hypothetical protein K439DRAFT_1624658 [Ramaria rubella]|nr:hypothetical protein K439DRAFT_1624658 [Ramaria rubella]
MFHCTTPQAEDLGCWQLMPSLRTELHFHQVYFDEHGTIRCSQWNRELILRKEPPFGHPILTQIINTLAFQGHLPIVSVAPDFFNPIPLPLISLACKLVHFALAHYVPGTDRTKHMKFSVDDYHPIYKKYTDALTRFKQHRPELCATVQSRFWDKGRVTAKIPDEESLYAITFSGGLSEAIIEAELAQFQQLPLQPQPKPLFTPLQPPPLFS